MQQTTYNLVSYTQYKLSMGGLCATVVALCSFILQYNVEGGPLEAKVNVHTYNYVRQLPYQGKVRMHNYDYATAENIFINPASATASFNTHVYDSANSSEVVKRSLYSCW